MLRHQVSQMISRRPKNLRRLWRWPDLRHQKLLAISGKGHKFMGNNCEKTKETLLTGELSDGSSKGSTYHVPKGFIAVYVGPELRRFVIPMSYLATPEFRVLMDKVAEEFGFEQEGGLQFPCDEQEFEQILLRCGPPPNVYQKEQ